MLKLDQTSIETSVWLQVWPAKISKTHQWLKLIQQVSKDKNSGDILCKRIKQSDWQRELTGNFWLAERTYRELLGLKLC